LRQFKILEIQLSDRMQLKLLNNEKARVITYLILGAFGGILFACIEYLMQIHGEFPEEFVPLIIRSAITGSFILGTVAIVEVLSRKRFVQRPFLFVVLVRTIFYFLIITFWLTIINGVWYVIKGDLSVYEHLNLYFKNEMYIVNLGFTFLGLLLTVGVTQINSLHRKGELISFVMGKYHFPREVERIFCFIDLKSSTSIAEKLGHIKFALFLKDYYSDITEALRETNAQIYQYVGDEIVLSWSYENGLANNNFINCFFQMREIINDLKPKYMDRYGVYPEFKAGVHGGKVIVTWIGELKKEIVYIGDVLNTTSRIQEYCKSLGKDFLISEELLKKVNQLGKIKASYVENTILRGKESKIILHSLELRGQKN